MRPTPFSFEEILSASQTEHVLFSRITDKTPIAIEIYLVHFCMDAKIRLYKRAIPILLKLLAGPFRKKKQDRDEQILLTERSKLCFSSDD